MQRCDTVLRSQRVVTPEGVRAAAVCVLDGRITAVTPPGGPVRADAVVDVGAHALLPGLVDTHVHVNEPGRTAWEGFSTATRAAAAGGVTTLLDMPLNSVPPTVSVDALQRKRAAADGRCFVDVGFWGGAVPGNAGDLTALHEAGVFGFKAFLVESGVDEFPPCSAADLETALATLSPLGALTVVHAEDAGVIGAAPPCHGPRYRDFLASRPPAAEVVAVTRLVEAGRRAGARVHVLHLSSAEALAPLAAARHAGVPITAETCPHYLCFAAEAIPDGATQFKCCPPIREEANRAMLWSGLADGAIEAVVSDHSPAPAALKHLHDGDFGAAWGGISSLQLGLPAMWTEASARGHGLDDVARWMASGPARVAGVPGKGAVAEGYDADLVVFDPEASFTVDPAALHHRHPVTPYAGRTLRGVVTGTWLRGAEVRTGNPPAGRLLRRGERAGSPG